MHHEAYDAIAQLLQTVPAPRRVVELGSRNVNGSIRPLFRGVVRYIGVDVLPGLDVDVVCDAAAFTMVPQPDCIVCCEVLEHAAEAEAIVRNMLALVAPGGSVLITCASDGRAPHSAIDGGIPHEGEFYRNVSPALIEQWLRDAGAIDVDVQHRPDRGDVYAVATKPSADVCTAATEAIA